MYIDHIAIWTEDLEKIKDFYVKYFDCTANEKYENKNSGFSSYFLKFHEGTCIELMNKKDIYKQNSSDYLGLAHLAINVGSKEKVDFLTRDLENDGYKIISQPRQTGDGFYESLFLDPENNRIEITAGKN